MGAWRDEYGTDLETRYTDILGAVQPFLVRARGLTPTKLVAQGDSDLLHGLAGFVSSAGPWERTWDAAQRAAQRHDASLDIDDRFSLARVQGEAPTMLRINALAQAADQALNTPSNPEPIVRLPVPVAGQTGLFDRVASATGLGVGALATLAVIGVVFYLVRR